MDNNGQNTQDVITMTRSSAHNGFAPLAQIEAYWEDLRGARLMPSRAEIDPRGIESALEYAFIVERIAPGIARLRIAGSHLSDLMGMEVRGMPLTSLISAPSRRQLSDTLEEVFETPATCTISLGSEAGPGMPELKARMVLMPLKSDLGDVSRVLGGLVALGDMGRSPRRFTVQGVQLRPILTSAGSPHNPLPAPTPSIEPAPKPKAPTPEFAEPKAVFKHKTPRTRETSVPYLRVVENDD